MDGSRPPDFSLTSIRRHLFAGGVLVVAVLAAVAGWASYAHIAGAVVASGRVVVDSEVKRVQHPTGGIIGELRVRDGDLVDAGALLLRLDDTQTRANLSILTNGLDDLSARRSRLEAERNGTETVEFEPDLVVRRRTSDAVERLVAGEDKLFSLRRTARDGQKKQLREQSQQLEEQITGLTEQTNAKELEIKLVQDELKGVQELWSKNLVSFNRVTTLQREAARLGGERGQLIATRAQVRGKIAEIGLQIIQVDQDLRSKVAEDLAEVRAKTAELSERKVAAEDQLKRIDIKAPQRGRVLQLAVHSIGEVIGPAQPIMLIVPDQDALVIEARVSPIDIDQIQLDQQAVLRFSAFNQRTTPEINGVVSRISADLIEDQHSGAPFYTLRITVPTTELLRLKSLKLLPGMPVEAFVQTGTRNVLSYLVKPLTDQLMRAFRDG